MGFAKPTVRVQIKEASVSKGLWELVSVGSIVESKLCLELAPVHHCGQGLLLFEQAKVDRGCN